MSARTSFEELYEAAKDPSLNSTAGEAFDAMRTLGLDPVQILVVPRVLALVITLPLLGVLANFAGLIGGAIVGGAIAASRPAYGYPAPAYVDEGPYPACRMVRERFWDGYGWRVRRYEVCN